MGKYKFRLSDILPNAWFYKLKDMSKPRKNQSSKHPNKKKQPPAPPTFSSSAKITPPSTPRKLRQVRQVTQNQSHHTRKSYYFTRELNNGENGPLCNSPIKPNSPQDPPRKSSRQKPRKSTPTTTTANKASSVSVSVSVSAGFRTSVESVWTKSDSPPDQLWSSSSLDSSELEYHHLHKHETLDFRGDRVLPTETTFDGMISMSSSNEKDIIINVKNLELPRIITKPEDFTAETKNESTEQPMKTRKGSSHGLSSVRRISSSSTSLGIKLQTKSPRIANRKINQAQSGRRSLSSSTKRGTLSESFAVVKKSFDPQKDFRDSMVEMIMENNIKESKDLEDLLACYLSLNADEYHELIIDVFKQIWFDLN